MEESFDDAWARSVVEQLSRQGVEFADGLTEDDIARVGAVFGVDVPPELARFLRAGVPTSERWARWIDGPDAVLAWTRDFIEGGFKFDIEHGSYWHESFGSMPDRTEAAVEQALRVVRMAAPLIPIYGHRFITTYDSGEPRAVLSVYQAIDSIYYGNDFADYFANEFGIARPAWAADEPPRVPVWGELFDL